MKNVGLTKEEEKNEYNRPKSCLKHLQEDVRSGFGFCSYRQAIKQNINCIKDIKMFGPRSL